MTDPGTDPSQAKRALRARIKAARAAAGAGPRRRWSAAIEARLRALPRLAAARTCFVYVSTPEEVHTHALIDHLLAQGKTVAVPRITDGGWMAAKRFTGWAALAPRELGILTPAADAETVESVDVAVTPGLAFTAAGDRLGYGAGYYDRWFAAHPGTYRLAVAFELQLVPELPRTEDDVPVQAIATEQRLLQCNE